MRCWIWTSGWFERNVPARVSGGAMSVLLSCRNLSYTAGTKPLFQGLFLSVSRGDKIGLNGHNGCGKRNWLN